MDKLLSLIISVYNEEPALHEFYAETEKVLLNLPAGWDHELIFVNDGSRDGSQAILTEFAARDPRVKIIEFSRNFGHESAMIAGIDHAGGDAMICMDADLQHPPELIPDILRKIEEGNDVITMVRTKNKSAGWLKNLTSGAFYGLINCLSDVKFEANASDFFAVTKRAADVLRSDYRECVRFLRGYVQSIGFNKAVIEYEARPRVAGESKYSIKSLFRFSIHTILCFSDLPLKLGIFSGCLTGLLSIILLITMMVGREPGAALDPVSGLYVLILFLSAVLFILVGIIGEYLAIIFTEIKGRPVYIVKEKQNF